MVIGFGVKSLINTIGRILFVIGWSYRLFAIYHKFMIFLKKIKIKRAHTMHRVIIKYNTMSISNGLADVTTKYISIGWTNSFEIKQFYVYNFRTQLRT